MEIENLGKSIGEIFNISNRYIIPLYQRNYTWGKDQIETLIQDIYEAYNSKTDNYYIGSLVVLKRHNGDYEVIDGQQRLTTLSLLTRLLDITKEPVLTYESRPEVELFFKEFYAIDVDELNEAKELKITPSPQTYYLREAIDVIKDAKIKDGEGKDIKFNEWSKIKDYITNNVILVRVEIPEDTDVASYFEIMNNRGEQLQKHEILKARLMNVLDSEYHAEFDLIWTACSNIDTPIQQCFNSEDRKKYFGDNYNEFKFEGLSDSSNNDASDDSSLQTTINDILKDAQNKEAEVAKKDDNTDKSSEISSIIDFPNFLMHVLKLYAKEKSPNIDIKLNEKFLLSCASELFTNKEVETKKKEKVKEFLALLFKCRTLFDRYVIKVKGVENDEEFSWMLNKPKLYEYDNKTSVKYNISTFENNEEQNNRVIMAQSMLQVTFRQRIYKNWLQILLEHLKNENCDIQDISAEGILKCLHNYMNEHFKDLKIDFNNEIELQKGEKYVCLGVNTPHFLLNFIDYLYWVKQMVCKEKLSHDIKEFKFRYWNSVEHHLAQNMARRREDTNLVKIVDCLGNLFMISKNANSRLSDRDVKEKVEMSKDANMGANRQIIYEKTKGNNYSWDENDIRGHYVELRDLLKEKDNLLNIQ